MPFNSCTPIEKKVFIKPVRNMIMSYLLTRSLVLCFKASSGTSVIFISDEPGTPLIMYGVSELIDAGEDAGTSAGAGVNWFPILNGNLLG